MSFHEKLKYAKRRSDKPKTKMIENAPAEREDVGVGAPTEDVGVGVGVAVTCVHMILHTRWIFVGYNA